MPFDFFGVPPTNCRCGNQKGRPIGVELARQINGYALFLTTAYTLAYSKPAQKNEGVRVLLYCMKALSLVPYSLAGSNLNLLWL